MIVSTLALLFSIAALLLAVLTRVELARQNASGAVSYSADPAIHVVPNPYADAIRDWLDTSPQVALTTDAILAGALPGTPATRTNSAHVTTAMKSLGYHATRVRLPERETLARVWQLASKPALVTTLRTGDRIAH